MSDAENLSPIKRAILELREMREQLDAVEYAQTEPIAIVGMGLRFPGDATTPDSYWALLRDGVDAISDIPADRWNVDAYYDADPNAPGKMYTRAGGFLKNVDQFDSYFFGISPREAVSMDPQQRLLLETSWEALEHASIAPDTLHGSQTGVFFGMSTNDYGDLVSADIENIDVYFATGNNYSVAAGRLSYILGLHGPSMVVDTACSSSLVAIHLACQSLRNKESNLAISGGVNVILAPETNVNFSKAGMMAKDDRCKTFDAAADGYVRGEGCGVVVLKRLSDAVNDGDSILALIRGSAINQDGRSSGLTAPNGPSQEAVIRTALVNAGLQPNQVDYVEAHGTGTSLGDPIEVRALAAVLGQDRPSDHPLYIGSAKTNFGHLEAAAGMAGLLKVVLSLQHGEIPPHLHLQKLNPYIAWDTIPLAVPTERTPWDSQGKSRIAGVSSFGFSGTNAHVILEEAPVQDIKADRNERPLHLLALSGQNSTALAETAAQLAAYLSANPAVSVGDVTHTMNAGRSHFTNRAAILADSTAHLQEKLAAFASGTAFDGLVMGQAPVGDVPEVAFLFSGQGAQYAGMGRDLYETQPVFRAALDECNQIAQAYLGKPLLSVLYNEADASLLSQMLYAQVAIFAVEYALATLWLSWGVQPTTVMGHSVGEYAAACIAGVFSLADGIKLVATRGRLMDSLPGNGDMVAVLTDEARVAGAIAPYADRVSIAAVNSPQNITISGESEAVKTILADLKREKIHSRPLAVTQASHSPMVEPMLDEFESVAATVTYFAPRIGLVSAMTTQLVSAEAVGNPRYWREHTRHAVQFAGAIQTLYNQNYRIFLEIGPNPTLLALGRRCVPDEAGLWLPSLRQGWDNWTQILDSLANLYVQGIAVDWQRFDEPFDYTRRALPTYPFQRQRYWVENVVSRPSNGKSVWETAIANGQHQSQQAPLDLAVSSYPAKWDALNHLATAYIISALHKLGIFTIAGEQHTVADLLPRLNVAEGYGHLLGRWLDILTEEQMLIKVDDRYTAAQALPSADGNGLRNLYDSLFGDIKPLVDYVMRCGEQLTAILTGVESPLETLFPGGEYATVEFLYHNWAVARYCNGIARSLMESIAHTLPASRPIRVLEVGAGTGGTTGEILPALPADRTQYTFTDVTDFFLARAQDKFSAYPFVRYGLLNLEQDPIGQGYVPHSFDVVLAANVLHATVDLNQTLQYVRSLLAPGGMLVLYEATDHPRWFDVTIGLIEGWGLFADEWRAHNPLLTQERWAEALHANGFESTAAFPSPDSPAAILGQSIITAQVPLSGEVGRYETLAVGDVIIREWKPEVETAAPEILAQLENALQGDRQDLLVDFVRKHVSQVLRLDASRMLDRRERLLDAGLDSLMAVELRSRLSKGLGLAQNLPATLIFDYPTIESVAEYLLRPLGLSEAASVPEAILPSSEAAPATDVENLSEDEVEALLLKKLRDL